MYKTIKLSTALMMATVTSVWAMDADQLKEQSLEACKTSSQQVPEEYREQTYKTCKCTVEKTDYEAVLAGNTEQVQADALKNAQECAKEMQGM